ncbi:hypothetical protein [Nonomuraea sediminis]|uniref:hypothetical protein n=1 Tax=Nonomuraea sediminis TaxID=2835864 RepID=UPI00202ABC13|nr:hypothetical protein [Nonomuraea sediminis]
MAAAEMTAPPYEWPIRMIGPLLRVGGEPRQRVRRGDDRIAVGDKPLLRPIVVHRGKTCSPTAPNR